MIVGVLGTRQPERHWILRFVEGRLQLPRQFRNEFRLPRFRRRMHRSRGRLPDRRHRRSLCRHCHGYWKVTQSCHRHRAGKEI